MHDLIPLGPAALPALGTLTDAEIDATKAYGAAEKALATRAAYLSDWRDFAAWCALRGATAMPAHQGIVAAYLSWLADSGRKASTIGRRAAAIGYHHKICGHEPPTNGEGARAVLRGIRRTIGAAKQGKAPATADLLMQMVVLCPDNMIGKRDRALLYPGLAGAFRRSELCEGRRYHLRCRTGCGCWSGAARATGKGRGRRWRFRVATGSTQSRRCRRDLLPPRSAAAPCSGPVGQRRAHQYSVVLFDLGDQHVAHHDLRQPAREFHHVVPHPVGGLLISASSALSNRLMAMSSSGPPSSR
jgi:hypothetical protein